MDGLTVGRMVHYVVPRGEHRAAIMSDITDAESGLVSLHVCMLFRDAEPYLHASTYQPMELCVLVPYDETGKQPHTWHWIEAVPPATDPKPKKTEK